MMAMQAARDFRRSLCDAGLPGYRAAHAAAALRFAGRLAQKGIKVNAGFTIDPIGQGPFWIWKSWNFFKPRTTKIWENFYQRGDNDLFGAFRGNPVQNAKNTQLHNSDIAWADFNFYKYVPKHRRHHSGGWFYSGAHTNGWILELSVVGNSFEKLLSGIPARRRSYK